MPVWPPVAGHSALVQHPEAAMQVIDVAHFFGVPPLQVKSQFTPSVQVAVPVPPAGAGHGLLQRLPQFWIEVLSTQDPAQLC